MRLIELRGPDAAESHELWRRRIARWRRVARALWAALQPSRRRRQSGPLEFYAEAGAPEGSLYVDGQLRARLDGIQKL